jgi:hypothetical protein
VFRGADAVGRGIVGQDGGVDIVPDVPIGGQDELTLSLQQDGAFPAQEAVQKRPQTSLTFTQPTYSISQSDNPNPFDGKLPAFAGAKVRVVYTPTDPTHPSGTIEHTVSTNAEGVWTDQADFTRRGLGGGRAAGCGRLVRGRRGLAEQLAVQVGCER